MAETWVLNATITLPSFNLKGAFTSNGTSFTGIAKSYNDIGWEVLAYNVASAGPSSRPTIVFQADSWVDDAYRTLVFDTSPTGAMLTWLQANGVKQSDPEPETPANSCMVDGTIYGIKTGTALVNGTAQTIYNGRTLVAGAGYDIVLSSSGFTVTIDGNGTSAGLGGTTSEYAAVVINGTAYTSAATVEVANGTTITLRTNASNQDYRSYTKIIIDGVTVAQGTTSAAASYIYTPTGNITVTLAARGSRWLYGTVTVTTT